MRLNILSTSVVVDGIERRGVGVYVALRGWKMERDGFVFRKKEGR